MNIQNILTSMKDPIAMYNTMMDTNPQFRQFVAENKDKTPDQIASEHGIDLSQLKKLLK